MSNLVTKSRLNYFATKLWNNKIKPELNKKNNNYSKICHILDYCTADSNGMIKNQDDKIVKCFNENKIIYMEGYTIEISSDINANGVTLKGGKVIRKQGSLKGSIVVNEIGLIEGVSFEQQDSHQRNAMLLLINSKNIKVNLCAFSNAGIDISDGVNQNHYYVEITDCNFSSTNKTDSKDYDTGNTNPYYHPQNSTIRAVMLGGRVIRNIIVKGCRADLGRTFISLTNAEHAIISNNIIRGNEIIENNILDLCNFRDCQSVTFSNNSISNYKTTNSIITYANIKQGSIDSNTIYNSTATNGVYVTESNKISVKGNSVSNCNSGIVFAFTNCATCGDNIVNDCNQNGIVVRDQCYHFTVSNNSLSFNNKYNQNWTASLVIINSHCFTSIGNYVNTTNSAFDKPALSLVDSSEGRFAHNKIRGYVDVGRNTNMSFENNDYYS